VSVVEATVLRDNLCRFDDLPLVARVPSLPAFASGKRVALAISDIDLLELAFHCEFRREVTLAPAEVDVLLESEVLGPSVATER